MPRPFKGPVRIQVGLSGWVAIVAALALFAVLAVAIAFLTVGLFVFFLPVLLIAPILYYFIPNLRPKVIHLDGVATQWETKDQTIIDGEFRVVNTSEVEGQIQPPDEIKP